MPDPPSIPSTSVYVNDLIIDWEAPYDQGTPITGYKVEIRHPDGVTFSEELTYCDGSDSTIVANTQCSVPLSVLLTDPFNKVIG